MGYRQTVVAKLLLAATLAVCAATLATAERRVYIDWMARRNYSGWARDHGTFYKGDYLMFYHPEKKLDVVEVNKHGYDTCDTRNPIHRYPGGANTAFLLSEAKFDYFTCSTRYFCPAGMRLEIPVQERRRTPASARDDTSGTAMVESSATLPAPGPERTRRARETGRDEARPVN